MSLEIPSALIREIQIGLRKEAGIPSYDPTDPSILELPSLDEAIAKSDDPSLPSYLRCSRCRRGGLLRGLQSTLCVFCGEEQRREGVFHSISFNSTAAYRNLLDSLGLDGSEAIILDAESDDSNDGRDTPKAGLVLSSLLDTELKWPTEKRESGSSSTNMAPSISAQAVNLSGVDLDTFFFDSKNETASEISEHLMPKDQIASTESHGSSGSENFGFFENLRSDDMAVSSANSKGNNFDGSAAVWEAEFQSAGSATFPAKSKSFDHFQGSSESASPAVVAPTCTTESKSVDLFQTSVTEFASPTTAALSVTGCTDTDTEHHASDKGHPGEPTDEWGKFSSIGNSIGDDLFHNAPDQFRSMSITHSSEVNNDEHNMMSVSNTCAEHEATDKGLVGEPSNEWGQFSSSGNLIQDDLFQNAAEQFGSMNIANSSKLNNDTQEMTSTSNSWAGDDIWPARDIREDNNTTVINDRGNSFEDWQDFTKSKEAVGGFSVSAEATSYKHSYEAKLADLQDMEFGRSLHSETSSQALSCQKGSGEVNGMQFGILVSVNSSCNTNDNDASLESWQDFTSANEAVGDLSNYGMEVGTEVTSGEHASVNLQDTELGSFFHSDSFSGALDGHKGTGEVNNIHLNASDSASSIKKPTNTNLTQDSDNSLEDWQDFTSSNEAPGVSSNSSPQAGSAEVKSFVHTSGVNTLDQDDMEFGGFFQSYSSSEAITGQKGSGEVSVMKLDSSVSSINISEINNTKVTNDNDGYLDAWQDFTSSNAVLGALSNSSNQTGPEVRSFEHAAGGKSLDLDDLGFGSLFHSFSGALNGQTESVEMKLGASVSSTSIKELNDTKNTADSDDSLDDWNDFASSSQAPEPPQQDSSVVNGMNLDSSVSSSNINEINNTKGTIDNDDHLDAWQDFTSSNDVSGGLSNSAIQTGPVVRSFEHAPGGKSLDLDDLGFGGIFRSFSGSLSGQKDSGEVNDMKLDASVSSSSIKELNDTKNTDDNDDPLDAWNDFTSSNHAAKGLSNSSTQNGTEVKLFELASGVKSLNLDNVEFGRFLHSYSFSGATIDLKGSGGVDGLKLDTSVSRSNIKEFSSAKGTNDNGDYLDAWQDFTSSVEAQGCMTSTQTITENKSLGHARGVKSLDLAYDFGSFLHSNSLSGALSGQIGSSEVNNMRLDASTSSTIIKEFNNAKGSGDNDDSWDAWQDFTSANEALGGMPNSFARASSGSTSHVYASATKSVDLQDMEFGSCLHSDFFLGVSGGHQGSGDASHSYRTNGMDYKSGTDLIVPESVETDEKNIAASNPEVSNSKVELLLSEMPDLSFMLDSNLSIPKKVDDFYLNA